MCGGGLTVETYFTTQRQPRRAHYVCNRRRASGACWNTLRIPVADMEDAVLTAIEDIALTPEGIGPDDVYYAGERDADFGEVLRKAANRKVLASPTGFGPSSVSKAA